MLYWITRRFNLKDDDVDNFVLAWCIGFMCGLLLMLWIYS